VSDGYTTINTGSSLNSGTSNPLPRQPWLLLQNTNLPSQKARWERAFSKRRRHPLVAAAARTLHQLRNERPGYIGWYLYVTVHQRASV